MVMCMFSFGAKRTHTNRAGSVKQEPCESYGTLGEGLEMAKMFGISPHYGWYMYTSFSTFLSNAKDKICSWLKCCAITSVMEKPCSQSTRIRVEIANTWQVYQQRSSNEVTQHNLL